MPDSVAGYADAVLDGQIVAGGLVQRAAARFRLDLDQAAAKGLRFDADAAARPGQFAALLHQSKGRWGGEPLELLGWQQFIVGQLFGWQREYGQCPGCRSWRVIETATRQIACAACGTFDEPWEGEPSGTAWLRRFRRVFVEVARKNGKTVLAAAIGLYLLDYDDEPGAEVYSAATKREQARICWDEAAMMRQQTAALRERIVAVPSTATLYVPATGSKFSALSSEAKTLDGLNPHAVILDELHAHPDRRVVDVLETAMGAREQPIILYITTAGLERASIYTEISDYARSVVEGRIDDDEWLVYVASLDPADDWEDPRVYGKANPSLGRTVQVEELIHERDRAIAVPGRRAAFQRLRLNMRTGQQDAWIEPGMWDACEERIDWAEFDGAPCYAGLDLASTTDIAALVLLFEREGRFYARPFFWVPEEVRTRVERGQQFYAEWAAGGHLQSTSGNVIDYDVIRENIRDLAATYRIQEIAYDRWNASQLITQLMNDGARCVPFGQGYASMSAPSKELEGLLASGKLVHDGNPVLRWMALNAQREEDPAGNIKPSRSKSADKIDGLVALIMALGRAIVDDGANAPSKYEREGLLRI